MEKTKPKTLNVKDLPSERLVAGKYGTVEMDGIWGYGPTIGYQLEAQAASIKALRDLYPDVIAIDDAEELISHANLEYVKPERVRELEEKTGHDIIALNNAWGEQVSKEAAVHINKARASACTTDTAKALQLKKSLEVLADSIENLRDITLERSIDWIDIPHMDTTHLYDALPTVLGRPFAFYGEMLQSDLNILKFVYDNSLMGKWADATGNHHSATALGLDGIKLEDSYCNSLGLKHMIAPAQIPGREFLSDVVYVVARTGETLGNLAHFIRMHRGDDAGIFVFPRGKKGSSSMPHKDMKGGNPVAEENTESFTNNMRGIMQTSLSSCRFDYARDLSGSASDRIILENMFKFGDYATRRMAGVVSKLEPVVERCEERVLRSYGVVTAQQVMTYLTDPRKTEKPMTREEAHELTAKLATKAYDSKINFSDIVMQSEEILSRFSRDDIIEITNPLKYIGQSKDIVKNVFERYHGKKTLSVENVF